MAALLKLFMWKEINAAHKNLIEDALRKLPSALCAHAEVQLWAEWRLKVRMGHACLSAAPRWERAAVWRRGVNHLPIPDYSACSKKRPRHITPLCLCYWKCDCRPPSPARVSRIYFLAKPILIGTVDMSSVLLSWCLSYSPSPVGLLLFFFFF